MSKQGGRVHVIKPSIKPLVIITERDGLFDSSKCHEIVSRV